MQGGWEDTQRSENAAIWNPASLSCSTRIGGSWTTPNTKRNGNKWVRREKALLLNDSRLGENDRESMISHTCLEFHTSNIATKAVTAAR